MQPLPLRRQTPDVTGAPHSQRAQETAEGEAEEVGGTEQADQRSRKTFQLAAYRHQRVGECIAHLHQQYRDQQRGYRGERSGHLIPPDRASNVAFRMLSPRTRMGRAMFF
jgi:hypothetical protein